MGYFSSTSPGGTLSPIHLIVQPETRRPRLGGGAVQLTPLSQWWLRSQPLSHTFVGCVSLTVSQMEALCLFIVLHHAMELLYMRSSACLLQPSGKREGKEEITGPERNETRTHCCPIPPRQPADSGGHRVISWLEDLSGSICLRHWPSPLPKGQISFQDTRGDRGVVPASGSAGNRQATGHSFTLAQL